MADVTDTVPYLQSATMFKIISHNQLVDSRFYIITIILSKLCVPFSGSKPPAARYSLFE